MQDILRNTLTDVTRVLDDLGIPYAITGSVASGVHGEPITSQDVDLLVVATPDQAGSIADNLSGDFYRDRDALVQEAQRHGMANLLDNRSGLKVDLSFVPSTGYLARAMERSVQVRIGSSGPVFRIVTPEDIILMKLLWRKESRSQKQWSNALGVVRARGGRLDWRYLFEQATQLDLTEDLTQLRDEGGV